MLPLIWKDEVHLIYFLCVLTGTGVHNRWWACVTYDAIQQLLY